MINSNAMRGQVAFGTLTDGTAVIVNMLHAPLPATVWVRAEAGDTVAVKYSTDGGVNYNDWANGSITGVAYSEDILTSGVTHLSFQRTAGVGVISTYGVC